MIYKFKPNSYLECIELREDYIGRAHFPLFFLLSFPPSSPLSALSPRSMQLQLVDV